MPSQSDTSFGRLARGAAAGLAMALSVAAAPAEASPASVKPVPGKPVLLMGAYDVAQLGYDTNEFFLSGTANSYKLTAPAASDGRWKATVATSSPYTTRIVVLRPSDPAKFNGTVLVEWFNVTAGQDTPADWMVAHREMVRRGYAYVGVSAQKVGVEGGESIMGMGVPLKKADAARYGSLSHPGDAFSYDVFSQAGAAVKATRPGGLLGPLVAKRVIALGESQSAGYLTTYVNAVDPLARVYDGFFIHSRFGSSAAVDGTRPAADSPGAMPPDMRFRPDLRVPLLTLITETDLLGGRLPGYHAARQVDNRNLRVWEIAGTAHADNYLFGGAFIDSGLRSSAELAPIFVPKAEAPGAKLEKPFNPGMPHHYVTQAAIAGLDGWLRSGKPPASTPKLELASGGKAGVAPALVYDANGLAKGGIRTPWVDVPTIRLGGTGNSGGFMAMLVGIGEPFDKAKLAKLYPGGRADYLKRFDAALSSAIRGGFILPEDRQEIREIAAINFAG